MPSMKQQSVSPNQYTIRSARVEDAADLLAIYAPYVENTAISFEYEAPSVEAFRERIGRTLEKYPYLVAEKEGKILGYAYAGAFHPRAAYRWNAELSIYLTPETQGLGLGRRLYEELENLLRDMGIIDLYAIVASPERPDEYLTHQSEGFHKHLGFETVAKLEHCGYKFGRWYHVLWMKKSIAPHSLTPPEPKFPL